LGINKEFERPHALLVLLEMTTQPVNDFVFVVTGENDTVLVR